MARLQRFQQVILLLVMVGLMIMSHVHPVIINAITSSSRITPSASQNNAVVTPWTPLPSPIKMTSAASRSATHRSDSNGISFNGVLQQQQQTTGLELELSRNVTDVYMDYNESFVLIRLRNTTSSPPRLINGSSLSAKLIQGPYHAQLSPPLVISTLNVTTAEWHWNVSFPVTKRKGFPNGTYVVQFTALDPNDARNILASVNFTLSIKYNPDLIPPTISLNLNESSPIEPVYVFNPTDKDPIYLRVSFYGEDNRVFREIGLKANGTFVGTIVYCGDSPGPGDCINEFNITSIDDVFYINVYDGTQLNASILIYSGAHIANYGEEGIYHLVPWAVDGEGNVAVLDDENMYWKVYSDHKPPFFNVSYPLTSPSSPISRENITLSWEYHDSNPNKTFIITYDSNFDTEEDQQIIIKDEMSVTFTINWTSRDVDPFYLQQGWWPVSMDIVAVDQFGNHNRSAMTLFVKLKAEDLPQPDISTSTSLPPHNSTSTSSNDVLTTLSTETSLEGDGVITGMDVMSSFLIFSISFIALVVILKRTSLRAVFKERKNEK